MFIVFFINGLPVTKDAKTLLVYDYVHYSLVHIQIETKIMHNQTLKKNFMAISI